MPGLLGRILGTTVGQAASNAGPTGIGRLISGVFSKLGQLTGESPRATAWTTIIGSLLSSFGLNPQWVQKLGELLIALSGYMQQ